MKTLLIDDDPFVLKLLAHQLNGLGLSELLLCERASEAATILKEYSDVIGLVICDLQMPEMDGVELIRHMTKVGYSGAVVLVSGEDGRVLQTAEKLAQAHKLDVLGALHKPVSSEQLARLLGKRAAAAEIMSNTIRAPYGPDELQRAITSGELVNYYQPKVELASGRLAGVETLVRWRHPEDGLIFPDQFIGTAEEHGLIDDLTRNVLAGALQQARRWLDMKLPLHVAVNVSMDNLTGLEFPDVVAKEVAAAGVPLTSLVLEVTESRLMKDPLKALDILTRLRLKHIGLSIDDFGTGHSSLAQLRDIPFDELKIDRSFVHGSCKNSALETILKASLNMARQLGMNSVAEGVEDLSDWQFLRAAGCNLAQGYFIARPMLGEMLANWHADWEKRRPALVDSTP